MTSTAKQKLNSLKDIPTICIFGPAGSGKGTQARVLSSYSNIFHLSTGDLFRSMPKNHPFFALCSSYTSRGALVPDEEVMKLVANYIQGKIDTFAFDPSCDLLLLDGLPRNSNQAKILLDYVDLQATIELKITSIEELTQRLLQRAQQQGRLDDASETAIRNRLKIYSEETTQALDLMKETCPLNISVNGSMPCASVSAQVLNPLSSILRP